MKASDARFVEIYENYHHLVYAYCRRRASTDRVDDAVAESFLVAWKKIDQVPEGSEALPWLYGVAYRVLAQQWRGVSRRRGFESRIAALGVVGPDTPDDYIITRHDSRQVLEAAARLKPSDQEILRLSLWEELTHSDIALVLDITPEAARQRLSRAVRALARQFDRLEAKGSHTPVTEKGGAW